MTENNVIKVRVANEVVTYTKELVQRMPSCQIDTLLKQASSTEDKKLLNSWIRECCND